MTTGEELSTFITALNADAAIDPTLLDVLVDNGRTVIEEERPWVVLRKTDTSKTVTPANTWQTAIDLSTITDFSRFYGEFPIRIFDGNNLIEYYRQVPFDRRLTMKDFGNTFVYDANAKMLYLNGLVAFSGTLYIQYISTSTAIDLTSASAVWTAFPSRFLPILGYYAIQTFKGAIDYDSINREMLPENAAAYTMLKNSMTAWDDSLQLSSIEGNDPTNLYGSPRPGSVNKYE